MNLTKEQINTAVASGLAITNPESDVLVPMKHASGAVILHQLLLAIASRQVTLVAAVPTTPSAPPAPPEREKDFGDD